MTAITLSDRGLAYGDGLFETILLRRGQPVWWSEHFARLSWGCRRLGLPLPDESDLCARIEAAVAANPVGAWGALKVIYTAGPGTRGYRRSSPIHPTVVIQCSSIAAQIDDWRQNGLAIGIQTQGFDGLVPLVGMKHLNRLPQVLTRMAWPASMDESLMPDQTGRLVGGTQSNFFWHEDGQWFTPPMGGASIAGTIRALLIAHLGIRIAPLATGRLALARAAVMTNAVWGVVPVRTLMGRPLDLALAQALVSRYESLNARLGGTRIAVTETAWWRVACDEPMMNGGGI
ncbi:MAG TPA: aminodeoxychorismate lyase [Halothiobacillus sp.]|nr:aminodeoxychorismate lyase [Halothiobacillus sp.]